MSNVVTAVAPPKITFYRYVGGVGIDDAIARYIDASGITSGGGGSGIDTSGANAGDVLVVDGSGNITFVTPGEADVILTGDVEQVVTANKIFNIGPVHVTNGLTVSGKITAGGGFQLPSGANQD